MGSGIYVFGGLNGTKLNLDRSLISRNVLGGIAFSGGTATITNNFIVKNGGTTAVYGGLDLGALGGMVAYNTIADNTRQSSAPSGITCNMTNLKLLLHHLMATSPCVDHGSLPLQAYVDYDGETRPNGALPDIGADEVYP
jgi:hypothetical protein